MTDKPRKIDDDELGTIVDTEIRQSIAYMGGTLSEMRRKAEYYFLGEAKGDLAPPAIEGRSAVVSTDVSDTVLWTLPALMEIFTAGDDVVEFCETNPSHCAEAEQMTDVCNYVFYQQNPGWEILESWFMDALLQKNGILKVWWDDSIEEVREEYTGLTMAQVTTLLQDPEVEPIEHKEYPDQDALQSMLVQYQAQMQQYQEAAQSGQLKQGVPPPQQPDPSQVPTLHDVTCKRSKKKGRVCIENVPPEEFIMSRRGKSIADTPFCGHHLPRTLSQLRAQGYENVDDISSDWNGDLNGERLERWSYDDDMAYTGEGGEISNDPSQRIVWITECYLQCDYDGDGIAEWRKVVRGGGVTLANEECDGPPFVSITPVRLPHRFFGRSLADLSMPAQRSKTALLRGLLDNMYLQINGRTWAVDGQVNLDDLLTTRPGQIVRVKNPTAVGALQQGLADSGGAYQLLEYVDTMKQDATGVTKYTQGSDADTLNKTKGGLENITQRADMRVKLIARRFAETGMKDLFRLIQKLLSQYQDKAMTIKLRDEWVDVDPRAWRNRYDMTVNVGLGTGDKTQVVQKHMTIGTMQAQGLQIGIATPQNIYANAVKATKALGEKNAEAFWTDPSKQPPKPEQPPIELQKIQAQSQADAQLEQQRHQQELERTQSQQQVEAFKAHLEQQTALREQQFQAMQADQENRLEAQRDLVRAQLEQETQRMQMEFDAQMEQMRQAMAVEIAHINAANKLEVAEMSAATTLQSAQISAANAAASDTSEAE